MTKSEEMARVRTSGSRPELVVRDTLRAYGIDFETNVAELHGKPDIYVTSKRVAIFVHGCFWHGHSCKRGKGSSTRRDFWNTKIRSNRARDHYVRALLRREGIRSVTIFGCRLAKAESVAARLARTASRTSQR